jgi:hypothetical protein
LRTETKEISRLYAANLQRDIVQLIEFLNEKQAPGTKSPRKIDPVFVQMKEKLDRINLKPEKGRRKDLKRIENAVRSLRKIAFADKESE